MAACDRSAVRLNTSVRYIGIAVMTGTTDVKS